MTPYIPEALAEINLNPELLTTKYKDNTAIRVLLQYAFDKTKRFLLPEGIPPFKEDQAPIGMSPTNFCQQVRKFYIFTREDLSAPRREQLFIQLLEGLHPSEAQIVLLTKDQTLDTKYPNINAALVQRLGLVSAENLSRAATAPAPAAPAKPKAAPKTSKGKNIVVNLSETAETKESFGAPPTPATETPVAKKRAGRPKKVQ